MGKEVNVETKTKNQRFLKAGMKIKVGSYLGEIVERCAGHALVSLENFTSGHDACGKYGDQYPPKSLLYVSDREIRRITRRASI